ncbi:MAG: hypothetical protein AB2L20_18635 [Mangrovibacterium sp.]
MTRQPDAGSRSLSRKSAGEQVIPGQAMIQGTNYSLKTLQISDGKNSGEAAKMEKQINVKEYEKYEAVR